MRQIGGFRHLLEALDFAAQQETQTLCWFDGLGRLQHECSYAQVQSNTQAFAAQLLLQLPAPDPTESDSRLGPRIGIIAATGPDFLPTFCACQSIGAIPCPLPVLAPLQDRVRYAQTVRTMCEAAGIRCVIGPKQLLQSLQAPDSDHAYAFETIAFEDLQAKSSQSIRSAQQTGSHSINPADIAYVQFSSGSTGRPKGIAISHAALMHNVDAILQHGMALRPSDRALSWLPYYHDMGLVGFVLTPLCAQVSVDYLAPFSFARRPYLWLDLMAQRGTTISYAPNFAWTMAVKAAPQMAQGNALNALRIAGVGGDYVDFPALQQFAQCFSKQGFEPNAFKPSYGLAEATLAVTFCQLPFEQQSHRFTIDDDTDMVRAAQPSEPKAKDMVNCGHALPGWRLQIQSPQGQVLPAQMQGQICLQGPAQMSGYFHGGRLHRVVPDQWLETGDIGFLTQEGALFITGRSKDLIVIHGRNVWPLDIENAVYEKTGIAIEDQIFLQATHHQNPGTQWHLLVHEKAAPSSARDKLLTEIAAVATATAGVQVHASLIPNGCIAYTSSGKKARTLSQSRLKDALTCSASRVGQA
ncbi:AMP-binding protein [Lampropedia aestuarii]|uniref:AMP-binding protein n=1 Tax=Lampropedia aestuarii TaxID=2562762 RepID=UPI0024695F77|nr:AMP-binding protein [Lampropedia aestuarii]MDH5855736.1 AMP-binding protein [Lampropedia aestuarii]